MPRTDSDVSWLRGCATDDKHRLWSCRLRNIRRLQPQLLRNALIFALRHLQLRRPHRCNRSLQLQQQYEHRSVGREPLAAEPLNNEPWMPLLPHRRRNRRRLRLPNYQGNPKENDAEVVWVIKTRNRPQHKEGHS